MDTIKAVQQKLPCGPKWKTPAVFTEITDVHGTSIYLAGISNQHQNGTQVFGSAGQIDLMPIERAYYELVERSAVISALHDAKENPAKHLTTVDMSSRRSLSSLFPSSNNDDRSRFSLSNGIALDFAANKACHKALCELVERDVLLRSWYGRISPQIQSCGSIFDTFKGPYTMYALYFGSHTFANSQSEYVVADSIGLPKQDSAPLICGFACDRTWKIALEKAERECMQRLGFLWGESIPETEPKFSPTADFHQEYYLWPKEHLSIEAWIHSGKPLAESDLHSRSIDAETLYFDLTPIHLKGKVHIVKAVCDLLTPLFFGEPSDLMFMDSNEAFGKFHPIA